VLHLQLELNLLRVLERQFRGSGVGCPRLLLLLLLLHLEDLLLVLELHPLPLLLVVLVLLLLVVWHLKLLYSLPILHKKIRGRLHIRHPRRFSTAHRRRLRCPQLLQFPAESHRLTSANRVLLVEVDVSPLELVVMDTEALYGGARNAPTL
jgi:hypothetical protein